MESAGGKEESRAIRQIGLAGEGAGETELGEDISRPPSEGLNLSKNNANL